MITLFCAFVGYLLNAFGFDCIKNGDDLMMAFLCEVFVETLITGFWLIIKPALQQESENKLAIQPTWASE